MKILMADDSRGMRQIVTRTLHQAGFDGHSALDATKGAEAYHLVQKEAPDLVRSDWNMPEMTAIQLLSALRGSGSGVPFGFVTSEGSPEMRQRAEAAGAMFLIAKPFTPDAFREALDPILG